MTETPHKSRITRAFGQAADYAAQARVQREAAETLANHVAAAGPASRPAILEIGCGTGFLSAALAARIGPADWTITDIAPEMVARAAAALDLPASYRVMDGERPDLGAARYDLIISSLAFQWFADLPGAVDRLSALLRPGGLLAFATMAAGSFAEWQAAHTEVGLMAGTPSYPDAAALQATVPAGWAGSVDILPFAQHHDDARAFLHQIKAIGAGVPEDGRKALPPSDLRRVMATFDAGPCITTYQIAFCLFRAPLIG